MLVLVASSILLLPSMLLAGCGGEETSAYGGKTAQLLREGRELLEGTESGREEEGEDSSHTGEGEAGELLEELKRVKVPPGLEELHREIILFFEEAVEPRGGEEHAEQGGTDEAPSDHHEEETAAGEDGEGEEGEMQHGDEPAEEEPSAGGEMEKGVEAGQEKVR
jgi:hypothetical protein